MIPPALEGSWIFFEKDGMQIHFKFILSQIRGDFPLFSKISGFFMGIFSIQKNHGVIIRKLFTSVPRGQSGNTKSHDGVDDEDQSLVSVWSKGYPLPEN